METLGQGLGICQGKNNFYIFYLEKMRSLNSITLFSKRDERGWVFLQFSPVYRPVGPEAEALGIDYS